MLGLVVVGPFAGCAASPPAALATGAAESIERPAASLAAALPIAATPYRAPRLEPIEAGDGGLDTDNYLTLKAGLFEPTESHTDTGYALDATFGHYFTRLFSVEIEGGYLTPDPEAPGVDRSAIPLMLNGRLNAPIWLLEAYTGAGIGTMFYDTDTGTSDHDGWVWAANAFVGAEIAIVEHVTGGLEIKYYFADEIRNSTDSLDGFAFLATFGWRF
jgi:opacity protein-like surface antigen